jgi:Na+-transporting methylmalonyl-CoA/oxaloacetate decarboxylase gamma subunit
MTSMKSSGSVWFVYGVAVVVTFLIGLLAFSVFVLSKVFGSSEPDPAPGPPPVTQAAPAPTPTPKTTAVKVLEIRPVIADDRQLVLIVATPAGCTRFLRATTYAEGPGAVAIRVTQQADRAGCTWQRKPVLATAARAVDGRTLIVNGAVWTPAAGGAYRLALADATRTSG